MTIERAIKCGLEDGFNSRTFDRKYYNDDDLWDDYYWAYRMGVLKKLNENPLEQMVITRTNECETCRRKGQPECQWSGIPGGGRRAGNAFILLCTEWEAME